MGPRTLYEKIWDSHVIAAESSGLPAVLYVDLHLIHERTSYQAFDVLRSRGLRVRRPELSLAITDHSVPSNAALRLGGRSQMHPAIGSLIDNAAEFDLPLFGPNDTDQGIVHVVAPELGLTLPGMTVACADSHTSTHGAFGALGFGIGTTEVGHVLATQATTHRRAKPMRVTIDGELSSGVTSKDLALHVLALHGTAFGRGHVIEFDGACVSRMSMEARMSLCNMAVEMGSRSGLVAPDEETFAYLHGRPHAPRDRDWTAVTEEWRRLSSDPGASFSRVLTVNAQDVAPMVTFGTSPDSAIAVDRRIPMEVDSPAAAAALDYMGLAPGQRIMGTRVDRVFIGSCTNARIEDLRLAAALLRGRTVAPHTQLLVVPGSQAVRRQCEEEGLAEDFLRAGGEWGHSGCSMCSATNGDIASRGELVASTSNRNFQGRQGPGARTMLMSPLTAAAAAVAGEISDPRSFDRRGRE